MFFSQVAKTADIPVEQISKKDFIFVRIIKPEKPHGAKALKNEDFIDHSYMEYMYAYSTQVTIKYIDEKYKAWQEEVSKKSDTEKQRLQENIKHEYTAYGYSPTFENMQRISKRRNYLVSYEMPERFDKYKTKIRYKNYETKDMFVEFSFYGPLSYPVVVNHTVHEFVSLDCVIPQEHYITLDMFTQEAIGNSHLKYREGSSFWALTTGDNELELSAGEDIGSGNVRVQTRYDMVAK